MSRHRHTLRRRAVGGKAGKCAGDMVAVAAKRARHDAPAIDGVSARKRLDRPGKRIIRKAGGGGIIGGGPSPSLRDIIELGAEEAWRRVRPGRPPPI